MRATRDTEFKFEIGATVVHRLHTRDHEGWQGVVTAREFYQDQDGSGLWYYIRWIEPDGRVCDSTRRLPECELRDMT